MTQSDITVMDNVASLTFLHLLERDRVYKRERAKAEGHSFLEAAPQDDIGFIRQMMDIAYECGLEAVEARERVFKLKKQKDAEKE